jgi:hypothetical protein
MNKGLARSANLSATSEFCTGKRFVGNDGHQYVIASGSEKAETKIVRRCDSKIEVVDKNVLLEAHSASSKISAL